MLFFTSLLFFKTDVLTINNNTLILWLSESLNLSPFFSIFAFQLGIQSFPMHVLTFVGYRKVAQIKVFSSPGNNPTRKII